MFAMYQSCNPEFASQMKQEDLFDSNGKYEPYNKWNGVVRSDPNSADDLITTNPGCIMHLAQKNNTLSAEIDIAAQGTVIRKRDDGTIISDPVELCNCSAYGNPTRNSDPKVRRLACPCMLWLLFFFFCLVANSTARLAR
jgi:hypothetical protein